KRPGLVKVGGTDAIAVRSYVYLALSYDHRIIDARTQPASKRPGLVKVGGTDAIAVRSYVYLALSYDHRIIDA
ncbi:hypothetical protein CTI14_71170, partial [Methylobacterium radiotolerans]